MIGIKKRSEAIYDDASFDMYKGYWNIKKDSLVGCATRKGDLIIEPQFEEISLFQMCDSFALVKKDGKWGVVGVTGNNAGKIVIPLIYGTNPIYKRGFVLTKFSSDHKVNDWGIVDTAGNIIAPFEHKRGDIQFFPSYYSCMDRQKPDRIGFYIVKDGKAAWYSMKGKQLTSHRYQSFCCANKQFAIFETKEKPDKVGVVDSTGTEIVPNEYDQIWYIEEYEDILARGVKQRKRYYFDIKGRILFSHSLDEKISVHNVRKMINVNIDNK